MSVTSQYDLPDLQSAIAGTLYAGKLHYLPETGSTNTLALHAAYAGAPEGTVFFSDQQTAGRGRNGHGWHSEAGMINSVGLQNVGVRAFIEEKLPKLRNTPGRKSEPVSKGMSSVP